MSVKGYKAYKKGLICSPNGNKKQYAENTIFEEDAAQICSKGMHFCKRPLDVLNYYPLVDENGEVSEFTEVEALDKCETDNKEKFSTKKLKVGAKISFAELVQASVNFEMEKGGKVKPHDKDDGRIVSKVRSAQIGSSGDSAKIGSSGYSAKIGSSGYSAQIGSSGDFAQIGSSGDSAKIGSSGDSAKIGSSGYSAKIGSSGDFAKIGSSGGSAQIGSSGYSAQIGSSGYSAQIGSSGDFAKIGSSGDFAQIASSGKNSVICCAGINSIAKAKIGSWITLSEWKYSDEEHVYIPICVKTEYVDGERIKADTFYKLIDGIFMEVK